MKISLAQARGRRSYQEDTFGVEKLSTGLLVWVADGHGGNTVSDHIKKRMPSVWIEKDNDNKPIQMMDVFSQLNNETIFDEEGSTLSVAFITHQTVHIGVLGDSPVLVSADGLHYIGPDHNARSNERERNDAIARGAIYESGYVCVKQPSYGGLYDTGPGLQMTRSLGDSKLTFLNRIPEVRTLSFGNHGDFVLIATDGLIDPSHHHKGTETTDIFSLIEAGAEAPELVTRATKLPTGDNVTAILVRP